MTLLYRVMTLRHVRSVIIFLSIPGRLGDCELKIFQFALIDKSFLSSHQIGKAQKMTRSNLQP